MLVVCFLCWAVLLAFGVRLTVGGWKHQRYVKRLTLMVLLAVPPLWAIFSFLPNATPNWAKATLVGLTALAANVIAERVVPHRVAAT